MRVCRTCKKEYPKTEKYFYKNSSYNGGLDTQCKMCACEYMRKRRKRIKNNDWNFRVDGDQEGLPRSFYKIQYKLGQAYHVDLPINERKRSQESFKGRLIQETRDFVVLEDKRGTRECFLKKDFYLDYRIREDK